MNRRQILKYTAMLTGAAICAPLTGVMLSGCSEQVKNTPPVIANLHFFSSEDFHLLSQLVDVILPKTDSPSASEVKVDYIIDNMFGQAYPADYQQKFMTNFAELKAFFTEKGFASLNAKEQEALLLALEGLPEAERTNAYWAYIDLKQQTVAFYLSTEAIAEHYLNYLPIPGEFKPCVPLAELGGKAWAI
ncbi:MAG: gluconate 2-dehydrogenase subunit 3 family protein [Paraglaciecola sp.]|uniref:gluconate 2-dehydrogenase subunit 3 family protein n=1 Tax=Paraglaciecola sp. TaxID=1920173 RepID=UPI00273ED82C|nr:gluconate 2-dehydrogenase subunit 3 family protein [Paraglaciecola sp.]MDP5030441.1 gluconate 2-dehydrogenase subunit 3 family protein [Paraglaciecola sp.]MDP5041747.1 gluconate 2-dehydrogenase subunit 3 family protein [Paraglaciecola sp.]MDP5131727.1 gluconate 2-dehydrogenase subunit 3 family protein [Paraglaciecola sp.]